MKLIEKNKNVRFSPRTYWKEILAIAVILLAYFFFKHERKELQQIVPLLKASNTKWIVIGFTTTIIYVLLQALMYIESFRSIHIKLTLKDAVELFLKRNFLSVFLPAGGVTSLAYTPTQIRRKNFNSSQIHQASAIYAYVGLLTVFIIGVPVIIYSAFSNRSYDGAGLSLVVLGLLLGFGYWAYSSIKNRKVLYKIMLKKFPSVITNLENIFTAEVNRSHLIKTILYSTAIEFCGIFHVFIAMYALDVQPSFQVAAIGYTVSVVLMIVSPFLRGLGAVEFSLLFILKSYGYASVPALGITILYRVFEFWAPLLFGLVAFLWRGRHLAARIIPAMGIFLLGFVNILSVATPPLAERMKLERLYVSVEAIRESKLMVLILGIALMVTAAYLIRGMKSAWIAAIIFASLSFIGHITKALDYEEALVALFIIILLLFGAGQYRIKSSKKWIRIGLTTFGVVLLAVLAFDFLSFYFIDKRHFGIDFTWKQSIYHTAKSFLLFADDQLKPNTAFGRDFLRITRFLGAISWLVLIYSLIRPRIVFNKNITDDQHVKARTILNNYGNSAVDYFKTTDDKKMFFSEISEGFIAYRNTNDYAIVLEGPVCDYDDKEELIEEFERFCRSEGLRTAYYRVNEEDLPQFAGLRKKKLVIGSEAILDVDTFKLDGKERKSLRNGLNSLQKKGYTTQISKAPHDKTLIDELSAVSDEWLDKFEKKEIVFSQGMFDRAALSAQDVIVVKDSEGTIQSFLNIIPDYTPEECTYDLIRRKEDAPGGCMDAMIVKLIEYAKEHNYKFLNLGLVPMDGLNKPENPAEQIIKIASQKMNSFKHYQSLKSFKEKYATDWAKKYLIFSDDFDLVQIPLALNKVLKPQNNPTPDTKRNENIFYRNLLPHF